MACVSLLKVPWNIPMLSHGMYDIPLHTVWQHYGPSYDERLLDCNGHLAMTARFWTFEPQILRRADSDILEDHLERVERQCGRHADDTDECHMRALECTT